MSVSEIRVKPIRANQGLGVFYKTRGIFLFDGALDYLYLLGQWTESISNNFPTKYQKGQ